jgi:hypothetical protein
MTIQVRLKQYRGIDGFAITGSPKGQIGGWPVSIFAKTRDEAERIRRAVNTGESWTFDKEEGI